MAISTNTCMDPQQVQLLMKKLLSQSIPQVLFKDWARQWLTVYQQGRVKDNTYQGTYWEPVELHLIPYFGDRVMAEIMPIDVAAFFKVKRQLLALETLKKLKVCLNGIFETAMENGLCIRNPVTSTLRLASDIPPREKHTWSREQYDIAYAFARDHNYVDMMVLMETAISRSELLGLTWEDFDPGHKILRLNNGLVQQVNSETHKLELVHDGLKNKYRHRGIPISQEITVCLFSLPRVLYVGGCKRQGIPPRRVEPTFIFHAPQGGPWSPPNWYHRRFRPFMAQLHEEAPEIPPLTPHEFRHTWATLRKDEGKDIYSIARFLGHKDLRMLVERYAHDNVEALRSALDIC